MNPLVDDLQLMTGIDIPVDSLGITVRQPRIKEIAMLGEQNYFVALSVFKMTREDLKVQAPEITNWIVFNESLKQTIDGVKNLQVLVMNFLQLFIPTKITLGPRSLIIDCGEEMKNIEPEQFDDFQSVISLIGGSQLLSQPEEKFKPINKRAADIAEKMNKARKKLASLQPKSKSVGFLAKYIKAVSTVTANSLENVNDMTIIQLDELMKMYLSWEAYDLEIKSRLAGAKGDDKLVHWIMRGDINDSVETI